MSHYAVIGDPVEHSKSPQIHRLFAEQTGQSLRYDAIRVTAHGLEKFITEFFATGGAGLNVTLPHKEAAHALCRTHSDRAALARAVNTLFLDPAGQLCGDNTDGIGMIRDIQQNQQVPIRDKRLLILGAGGAVRGVLGPLLAELPASVMIANRTVARAEGLAREFASLGPVRGGGFASVSGQQFDLVINGTSAGIENTVPDVSSDILQRTTCCYDMMYRQGDTAFVAWAKSHGVAMAVDGLGMLVEQAAEAFAIWRGVRPETRPVIAQLRR